MRDIDGSPLLILTQEDTKRLLNFIVNPISRTQDLEWFRLLAKIKDTADGE